jgi:hypothetical protein
MEVPVIDATLPLAPPVVAAPAVEVSPRRTVTLSSAAPVGPPHLRMPWGLHFSTFMFDVAFPVVSSGTPSCVEGPFGSRSAVVQANQSFTRS